MYCEHVKRWTCSLEVERVGIYWKTSIISSHPKAARIVENRLKISISVLVVELKANG